MSDDKWRPTLREAIEELLSLLPDDEEMHYTRTIVDSRHLSVILKSFGFDLKVPLKGEAVTPKGLDRRMSVEKTEPIFTAGRKIVDHVVYCAWFDSTDRLQRASFLLSNLTFPVVDR